MAPLRSAPFRLAPLRLAPLRSARIPPSSLSHFLWFSNIKFNSSCFILSLQLSGVIALTCVKLSCFNLGCQPVFVKIIKINFIVFLI
ncbi:hypothetical protein barba109G_phanotate162 [Rheinheimera phage vB_RspM_barba_10-9G]|uniref:Uncharacterized protein n=3 Tax=Barbavirus barba18A TaxID=2734090 RepID=A0A7G9VS75_9CAUD|nr:hypothetical protein barba109A_phanotate166 [Rheinheimera phage vB_RspM_barba_10-9A]QNO03138.1 hypothetical protein barba109G_phanotate162 [Rheinheimera phage vB_RspM_barba_10-9G]QNO06386.1 hypothetical protein barba127F_phanotate166 [Rheinheimera phage vB_RspM_barba_12-7F]QNO08481.1 hypothetical protein barba129A_phanotate162 [Rheinheimera phage vB_RspM_barba_12-9A]QNO09131.1 hypothetical protein barba129E_phanotate162 [Rheinheimera phage vB_RspM_barba_12-9E]